MKRLKKGLACLLCLALLLPNVLWAVAEEPPLAHRGGRLRRIGGGIASGKRRRCLAAVDTVPTEAAALEVGGKSAILMDQTSGTVLFEKNAHEKLAIASVTKIMTLLLVMEALDQGRITLEDPVTCSDVAASMGGIADLAGARRDHDGA